MRHRLTLPLFALALAAARVGAQSTTPAVMPSGNYIIQARDTAKVKDVAIAGWPFTLKGNGAFTITTPDSLTFSGKLSQKDGVATYTDQSCDVPALYTVRLERGGFGFDFKSGGCPENATGLGKLLFMPAKPPK